MFTNFQMKNQGVKREKRIIFFCKFNIKGQCFYTVIYAMTIKIFTDSLKELEMKKMFMAF